MDLEGMVKIGEICGERLAQFRLRIAACATTTSANPDQIEDLDLYWFHDLWHSPSRKLSHGRKDTTATLHLFFPCLISSAYRSSDAARSGFK
jgi:hypothetical protein